jgi:hypothetical protein
MGSMLYLTELPPVGGDTLFASMYAAYERLSPAMQEFLSGLVAMHDGDPVFGARGLVPRSGDRFAQTEHPIVRTHPVTGRKLLFVNQEFTTRIKGLSKLESDALLQDAVAPRRDAGIPVPLPLAEEFGGVLGQSLRPAPRDVGLLPAAPPRLPRHDRGRRVVLPSIRRVGCRIRRSKSKN